MPRANRGMKRTNLYIEEAHLKGARWLAAKQSLGMSDIVRAALKEYLIREVPRYKKGMSNEPENSSANSS